MADLSQYVPRLPFDVLAQFEAASGLIFLNLDAESFMQTGANYARKSPTPEDIELYSTINHETYHYFQTLATGYQYSYASKVWRLIADEADAEVRRQDSKRAEAKENRQQGMARWAGFEELINNAQRASEWENAAGDDLSLLSAEFSALARSLDLLWEEIKTPKADGLSALDLIEGGAIIFEHLMTHGREGLEDRLAKAWDATGETYRRAFEVAQRVYGPRTLDIVLPATALALRYESPPDAFAVFLQSLNASDPGSEISAARAHASKPPRIEGAGVYLGTALDVRNSESTREGRFAVYDDVLDKWEQRAWDFDEIELLSDRGAAQRMGWSSAVMVVKEGPILCPLSPAVLIPRLLCGSLVLRTAKLPRYRREAEKRLLDRMHPIIGSLVDPLGAADEYNELGLNYLKQGDTDQAELMMERALSLWRQQQFRRGIAWQKYNLGLVYAARNERERAQDAYRESLTIAEEIQDAELTAKAAANLGHEYAQVGRLEDAEGLIRRALALEESLGLKEGMAIDLMNLGNIYYARKEFAEARALLSRSAELYRAVGGEAMADSIEKAMTDIGEAQGQV